MKFAIAKSPQSVPNSWTLRVFTLLIWLLVTLCAAYWAFKFVTNKRVDANVALAPATLLVDSKAVGKLLGATDIVAAKPINTPASTKFVLSGLANSAGGRGYALIALDGKPAKPYRVGSLVADDLVLKSIAKTSVLLASSMQAPEGVTLELPERKPATTVANFSNVGSTAGKMGEQQSIRMVNPVPVQPPAVPVASAAPPQIPPQAPNFVQANGVTAGAAAAISRFAPQQDPKLSGMSPDSALGQVGAPPPLDPKLQGNVPGRQ